MAETRASAGTRTRILHILSDSVPQSVRFTAEPVAGAGEPTGLVEVERSRLFAGRRTEQHPLQPQNTFQKGMFDVVYSVFVTPDEDTEIVFQSRHVRSRWLIWVLVLVLIAGIAAGSIAALSGRPG